MEYPLQIAKFIFFNIKKPISFLYELIVRILIQFELFALLMEPRINPFL